MVTDLRAINKAIQPMGPLQSEIPLSSQLPKGLLLIVIDLKDFFFSIPLQKRKKFAFTVPAYNNLSLVGGTSGLSFHRECSISLPCVNIL